MRLLISQRNSFVMYIIMSRELIVSRLKGMHLNGHIQINAVSSSFLGAVKTTFVLINCCFSDYPSIIAGVHLCQTITLAYVDITVHYGIPSKRIIRF